jgi:hypothetical protein
MMNKIREWYIKHDVKITWFLIGYTVLALAENIGHNEWIEAAINAVVLVALITADRLESKNG